MYHCTSTAFFSICCTINTQSGHGADGRGDRGEHRLFALLIRADRPRQDPNSDYAAVIPCFVHALVNGARPSVYGDSTQTRDFVYISDVVAANLLAAEAPAAVGSVINIGCGERVSLLALLAALGELMGASVAPEFVAPRPGDIHDSVAGISRARQLLGYEPRVDFHEGLALTVAYFRQAAV